MCDNEEIKGELYRTGEVQINNVYGSHAGTVRGRWTIGLHIIIRFLLSAIHSTD